MKQGEWKLWGGDEFIQVVEITPWLQEVISKLSKFRTLAM